MRFQIHSGQGKWKLAYLHRANSARFPVTLFFFFPFQPRDPVSAPTRQPVSSVTPRPIATAATPRTPGIILANPILNLRQQSYFLTHLLLFSGATIQQIAPRPHLSRPTMATSRGLRLGLPKPKASSPPDRLGPPQGVISPPSQRATGPLVLTPFSVFG